MNRDSEMEHDGAAQPVVREHGGLSMVWLVPLITALIGGWLIFKTLSEQGPQITITFQTAEGIEAGKTQIKYKNVAIGTVEAIRFNEDFTGITVTASMDREAEIFLRRDTRFWVVRPRLDMRGVSGLGTLVSGAYIEIEPGRGTVRSHFTGLESPPVVKDQSQGREVMLMTRKLGSIGQGSPIYYQGVQAGEVTGYELANDKRSVLIHAFIDAPFDQLVKGNTRFWNVSGIDFSADSSGVNLRTESITSLIYGGISFDTPEGSEVLEEGVEGLVYTLYDNYQQITEQAYTKKLKFVLFFDGSVRGLNIGAPVEFKGIKVGAVTDIHLEFDQTDTTFRIPVMIEIEPERVVERGSKRSTPEQMLQTLVDHGLRARLKSGSLLTGQLLIELDMFPASPMRLLGEGGMVAELPTMPAEFDEMTASVKDILAKFERVDIEGIASELHQTLQGTNRLANSEALQAAVLDAKESLAIFHRLLERIDQRAEPMVENLDEAVFAGRRVLEKLEQTLGYVNGMIQPGSPTLYRFDQMTEELSEMARSIRTLVDLLEREPQSVLFGKEGSGGE